VRDEVGIGPLGSRAIAVFFDRDGVLNRAIIHDGRPYPATTIGDLVLEDGCAAAISKLAAVVPLLFVVSNQPDVARGTIPREQVEKINAALGVRLPITKFYTCYHDDSDNCTCRKPLPGSLFQAARDYDLDLSGSFMVGDRWRDIEAGFAAGCTTVLIQRNYAERAPRRRPDVAVRSITEAVDSILARISDRVISHAN
jgi:D-glycero-D-manno-heptose 1,7-bisphosphate phosphatase